MGKSTKNFGTDVFEKAGQKLMKLRQSKVFKSLVLAGILLSQVRYPLDLVAQEDNSNERKTFVTAGLENGMAKPGVDAIEIRCKATDENLAEFCRDVMVQVFMENEMSSSIFDMMIDRGTVFVIGSASKVNNGSYKIGKNEVCIPRNVVESAQTDKMSLDTLKNTLRHESVHFLQDCCGIFDDCKKLRPAEVCAVYTMAELDAMIKAVVMENPDNWNVDKGFDCFVDLVPMLYRYTNKALFISKSNDAVAVSERLKLSDVLAKFNRVEFGAYTDMESKVEKLRSFFDEKMQLKISAAEAEYDMRTRTNLGDAKNADASVLAMGKGKAGTRD